jgi:hypothetical protein
MDPIKNPYSPGAGSPPPEMVGRDPILEQARILLGRIKAKRPEKSLMLTGLRGVGKTVLLIEQGRRILISPHSDVLGTFLECGGSTPLSPPSGLTRGRRFSVGSPLATVTAPSIRAPEHRWHPHSAPPPQPR